MTLLHLLSECAEFEARRQLPDDETRHAKRAVFDWLAALYPDTQSPLATRLVEAWREEFGVASSSSVGGVGATAFPATAAWVNASVSHAVEFDDIYREAVYHRGSPVVAAAPSVAEAKDSAGSDFLRAIVVGYEISTRIGAAFQPSHASRFHAIFPAIDAALALRTRHVLSVDQISDIEVSTYPQAVEATGRDNPRTPYEGRFSLPYAVAHALVYGSVKLDAFVSERLNDPHLRSLMRRVTVLADPAYEQVFPARRDTRVTITLHNGKRLTETVAFRRGDPELSLSDEALESKFVERGEPVMGVSAAHELREKVWRMDRVPVRELGLNAPICR